MNPNYAETYRTIAQLIKERARAIGKQAAFNEVLEDENFYGDRADIRVAREQIRSLLGASYRGINAHQI